MLSRFADASCNMGCSIVAKRNTRQLHVHCFPALSRNAFFLDACAPLSLSACWYAVDVGQRSRLRGNQSPEMSGEMDRVNVIQCNLSTTASHGTTESCLLLRGGCWREVNQYSNQSYTWSSWFDQLFLFLHINWQVGSALEYSRWDDSKAPPNFPVLVKNKQNPPQITM